MESKYDKVAYPENAFLHSDNEQEDFGTGVYPGVSIISRRYKHEDTIKIACFKVKRKFSRVALIGGCLAILLLIIAIIIISTSGRNEAEKEKDLYSSNKKPYGKMLDVIIDYFLISLTTHAVKSFIFLILDKS